MRHAAWFLGLGVVLGLEASGKEANLLKPLAGRMEAVRSDLERQDTGAAVQLQIDGVLEEIDRLLEASETVPPGPGPDGPRPPVPQPKDPRPKDPDKDRPHPRRPLSRSRAADRDGAEHLRNGSFASGAEPWGRRVPIDPEKSAVLKPREGTLPPEYAAYIETYWTLLAGSAR